MMNSKAYELVNRKMEARIFFGPQALSSLVPCAGVTRGLGVRQKGQDACRGCSVVEKHGATGMGNQCCCGCGYENGAAGVASRRCLQEEAEAGQRCGGMA